MTRLSKKQKKRINKIAQKYNLELILLFGSRVSGKIHADSDVDIAVLPKSNKDFGFEKYSSLISDFSGAFFGKKIDLSFINQANPLLLKKISENALPLFGSNEKFIEFKLKAFKYFQDYLPYFKLEEMGIRKYLQHFSYGRR